MEGASFSEERGKDIAHSPTALRERPENLSSKGVCENEWNHYFCRPLFWRVIKHKQIIIL